MQQKKGEKPQILAGEGSKGQNFGQEGASVRALGSGAGAGRYLSEAEERPKKGKIPY